MKRNVTLSIPNEKRFVPLALKVVEETAHLAGLEARAIRDILKAVRELVTNAVMHAYPKGLDGIIDVDILLQPHGIQVSVHDMGMPFNFDQYMVSERQGGLKRRLRFRLCWTGNYRQPRALKPLIRIAL